MSRKDFVPVHSIPILHDIPWDFSQPELSSNYNYERNRIQMCNDNTLDYLQILARMSFEDKFKFSSLQTPEVKAFLKEHLSPNEYTLFSPREYPGTEYVFMSEGALTRLLDNRIRLPKQFVHLPNPESEWPDGFNPLEIQALIRKLFLASRWEMNNPSVEIHEKQHYVDYQIRGQGAVRLLREMVSQCAQIFSQKDSAGLLTEEEAHDWMSIFEHQFIILSFEESEAILHEILGQQVITSDKDFQESGLSFRLANLLSIFEGTDISPELSRLELSIMGIESNDYDLYSMMNQYNLGFLVLLFGKQILSSEPQKAFDFAPLIQHEGGKTPQDVRVLSKFIYRSVQSIMDNPQAFAQKLVQLNRKDLVVAQLVKTRSHLLKTLITFSKKYPEYFVQVDTQTVFPKVAEGLTSTLPHAQV